MSSTKSNLRLIGALAALAGLALAISCQGFFPPKTLTSITVDPPTPSVDQGSTLQMYATGTFSDGSTGTLSSGTACTGTTVCWTESSGGSVTTISTGGLITGVATGTSTVTATASGISGDTTVTVALANVTGLELKPNTLTVEVNETTTVQCFAETSGGLVDVTTSCQWTVTNSGSADASIVGGEDPAVISGGDTAGSAQVSATYSNFSASATLTIN
jgi:hypothetical protein